MDEIDNTEIESNGATRRIYTNKKDYDELTKTVNALLKSLDGVRLDIGIAALSNAVCLVASFAVKEKATKEEGKVAYWYVINAFKETLEAHVKKLDEQLENE